MAASLGWKTFVRQVSLPESSLKSLWQRLPERPPRVLLEGVRWQGQPWLYLGWDAARHWPGLDLPQLRRDILGWRDGLVPRGTAGASRLQDLLGSVVGVLGHDALEPDPLTWDAGDDPSGALFLPGRVLLWRPGAPAYLAVNLPLASATVSDPEMLLDRAEQQLAAQSHEGQPVPGNPRPPNAAPALKANWSLAEFSRAVTGVQAAIRSGSLSKAVLSLRFRVPYRGPAFPVFDRLRRSNPSSLMYLLDWGAWTLIGASPEPLVSKMGDHVSMRPLAGTRRRGATVEEDNRLTEALRSSAKDAAEHRIALDQAASDLAQVCLPGSVEAPELLGIEVWPQVIHLASALQGTLAPGRDAFDLLAACSPAATVVGAPRREALALIHTLEPQPRGLYAGATLQVSPGGDLQSHIILRSLLLRGSAGYVQAGAGIVLESDPLEEYRECLNKAKAALAALGAGES
ncbi:MAG: anthranilate synthase component I family protein [Firmicutes bacterium]|nr:anthranilate synthase component I family protein [Bacillota bacterium]